MGSKQSKGEKNARKAQEQALAAHQRAQNLQMEAQQAQIAARMTALTATHAGALSRITGANKLAENIDKRHQKTHAKLPFQTVGNKLLALLNDMPVTIQNERAIYEMNQLINNFGAAITRANADHAAGLQQLAAIDQALGPYIQVLNPGARKQPQPLARQPSQAPIQPQQQSNSNNQQASQASSSSSSSHLVLKSVPTNRQKCPPSFYVDAIADYAENEQEGTFTAIPQFDGPFKQYKEHIFIDANRDTGEPLYVGCSVHPTTPEAIDFVAIALLQTILHIRKQPIPIPVKDSSLSVMQRMFELCLINGVEVIEPKDKNSLAGQAWNAAHTHIEQDLDKGLYTASLKPNATHPESMVTVFHRIDDVDGDDPASYHRPLQTDPAKLMTPETAAAAIKEYHGAPGRKKGPPPPPKPTDIAGNKV